MEIPLTKRIRKRDDLIKGLVALFIGTFTFLSMPLVSKADVPFRVSIKFIVNSSGNRPATGNFNTTADVNAETDAGNDILRTMLSEQRILVTEIIDLPTSLSGWSNISVSSANRDTIRTLAMASPTTWSWRTNAVNVYVTGGSGSAISKFPPNNDIILFGQNCSNNPSCLLHELGHSLNLMHTHEGGGADGCSDTLNDNKDWTSKDQMANANYGTDYANLTSSQKNNVDMTWSNFMSYHVGSPQDRFTPCQKDRTSAQGYSDKSWLLAKIPVYVGGCFLICNGSFYFPFPDLQSALDAGSLTNKAIVLKDVDTTITQNTINLVNVDIDTRQGVSHIDKGALLYELPSDLEMSSNILVSAAVKAAQDEVTAGREALRVGKENASADMGEEQRKAVLDTAREKEKQHLDNSINHLLMAAKNATGNEKLAIQLELAQRYWHRANYKLSLSFYNLVADGTDQIHLREKALMHAKQCQEKLEKNSKKIKEEDNDSEI